MPSSKRRDSDKKRISSNECANTLTCTSIKAPVATTYVTESGAKSPNQPGPSTTQPSVQVDLAANFGIDHCVESGFDAATMRNYIQTDFDLPTIEPLYVNKGKTVIFPFGNRDYIVIDLEPTHDFNPTQLIGKYPKIERKRPSESWLDNADQEQDGHQTASNEEVFRPQNIQKIAPIYAEPPFQPIQGSQPRKSAFQTVRKDSTKSDKSSGGASGSRSVNKENVPPANRPGCSRHNGQHQFGPSKNGKMGYKGNRCSSKGSLPSRSPSPPDFKVDKAHPKYKTEKCVNYPMGYCKFGDNCAFIHE